MSRHEDDDNDDRARPRRRKDDEDDRPRSRRRRDDDDDDDRPRRRRDDDDDDDYDHDHPRRKKAKGGFPWVIVAVVLVVLLGGCGVLSFALLLPAVQKVRDAAGRATDTNNLKMVGIGFYTHNDANRHLPPATEALSWRVHLLPYIEQQSVYRQFDLNQPWDGPANRRLADDVVSAYRSSSDPPGQAATRYRVFVGPGTIFEPGRPPKSLAEFKDGTANTILAIEAAETVPWPQPKELEVKPTGPLPAVGHPNRDVVLVGMADGSVRAVDKKKLDPTLLRALITPSGGEQVRLDW